MSGEDFLSLTRHINARLRGETPNQVRKDEVEQQGGHLPALHTPSSGHKQAAFYRGFDAIKEYIGASQDDTDEKLRKVGMASEALIILVHPFNDGNGRTSRFVGRFLESGTVDEDLLKADTVSLTSRRTAYDHVPVATGESLVADANDEDIISFDDNDRAELRRRAETAPDPVEAMHVSIKRLLESEKLQATTVRHRDINVA